MAKSKFEYVKSFEQKDTVLPNTWMVVRIDGRGFHRFTDDHGYTKPNDKRGLDLMNSCAVAVMKEFGDIVAAYGESDEYSFIFKKECKLFARRGSKIMTGVVSYFSACFVMFWPKHMVLESGAVVPLQRPPQFDARIVAYPSLQNIRDYLSWRQADCHINNLYNTTFWALVLRGNVPEAEAAKLLETTVSANKNEILFESFGINYNDEPEMYKKGTLILRQRPPEAAADSKVKKEPTILHIDVIGDDFWNEHQDDFPPEGGAAPCCPNCGHGAPAKLSRKQRKRAAAAEAEAKKASMAQLTTQPATDSDDAAHAKQQQTAQPSSNSETQGAAVAAEEEQQQPPSTTTPAAVTFL